MGDGRWEMGGWEETDQWFSFSKYKNREGTPRRWRAVKAEMPCDSPARKEGDDRHTIHQRTESGRMKRGGGKRADQVGSPSLRG